ncbi:hypothetical protein ES319_D04G169000v1 [Gossypium barbadense]|uniref:Uncharacterized protein n=2 Tax=Gossypium TaxID=3633 RepID=A0A5J5S419_GOSBA|nr:hypothetical protein ES319_D04G169000v1 [Gossypium barbadense]TYG74384.1 hypothetical protein ES288_D04G178700v1 [Gossypium darwinii]
MSLRNTSRELLQVESQVMQGIKDHKPPITGSVFKSSSKQVRNICTDKSAKKTSYDTNKLKLQSEESLRTVMYLSFWGPN